MSESTPTSLKRKVVVDKSIEIEITKKKRKTKVDVNVVKLLLQAANTVAKLGKIEDIMKLELEQTPRLKPYMDALKHECESLLAALEKVPKPILMQVYDLPKK